MLHTRHDQTFETSIGFVLRFGKLIMILFEAVKFFLNSRSIENEVVFVFVRNHPRGRRTILSSTTFAFFEALKFSKRWSTDSYVSPIYVQETESRDAPTTLSPPYNRYRSSSVSPVK